MSIPAPDAPLRRGARYRVTAPGAALTRWVTVPVATGVVDRRFESRALQVGETLAYEGFTFVAGEDAYCDVFTAPDGFRGAFVPHAMGLANRAMLAVAPDDPAP